MDLLPLLVAELYLATFRVDADVVLLGKHIEGNFALKRCVLELGVILLESSLIEELVGLNVEEHVDQPAQSLGLQQVKSCLAPKHRKVGEY